MTVYKGDIVQCWQCNLDLLKVTQDIPFAATVMAEMFEPLLKGYTISDGDLAECPECRALWFASSLHLKNVGWTC